MLADLIAADPNEAEAILSTLGHGNVWPTLEAKTVDQVKLSTLASILQGKAIEGEQVAAYIQSFAALASGGDDGPWIDLVPEELVRGLASLTEERIPEVAEAWVRTEEARLDRWQKGEVASFLKDLSAFSASALAEKRSILLWLCL